MSRMRLEGIRNGMQIEHKENELTPISESTTPRYRAIRRPKSEASSSLSSHQAASPFLRVGTIAFYGVAGSLMGVNECDWKSR